MMLNFDFDIDIPNVNKKTPLLIACEKNFFEISLLLTSLGANLNVSDSKGNTPLHYAMYNSKYFIIKL